MNNTKIISDYIQKIYIQNNKSNTVWYVTYLIGRNGRLVKEITDDIFLCDISPQCITLSLIANRDSGLLYSNQYAGVVK